MARLDGSSRIATFPLGQPVGADQGYNFGLMLDWLRLRMRLIVASLPNALNGLSERRLPVTPGPAQ